MTQPTGSAGPTSDATNRPGPKQATTAARP
jgi:hypothetical protein